jgi:hypothetical protein
MHLNENVTSSKDLKEIKELAKHMWEEGRRV